MDEQQLGKEAKEPVDARTQFRTHFVSFVVLSLLLAVINFFTTQFPWAVFIISGMAAGIAFEAWRVFGRQEDPVRRERMIEEETRKSSSNNGPANDAT